MLEGNGNGYSLADIAAASGTNDGFGGGSGAWWIIILFLFCFMGWGGNGFGGGNSGAVYQGTTTREELSYGFDMADLKNSLSSMRNEICGMSVNNLQNTQAITDAVNAGTVAGMQNTFNLSNQLNSLAAAQAQSACDNKMLLSQQFAQLNYNLASEACESRQTVNTGVRDIIDASTENTKLIMDFLTQEKIDSLTAENNQLRNQLSQSEQTAYLIQQLGGNSCSACNGYVG